MEAVTLSNPKPCPLKLANSHLEFGYARFHELCAMNGPLCGAGLTQHSQNTRLLRRSFAISEFAHAGADLLRGLRLPRRSPAIRFGNVLFNCLIQQE